MFGSSSISTRSFFNVVLYLVTLIIIYGWLKLNLVLNLSFTLMMVGLDSGWF